MKAWWARESNDQWYSNRQKIMELLQKEVRLNQIVKLVGPDALPDSQNFIIECCSLFKTAFLQQNAFDEIDRYCSVKKQMKMLSIIIHYYEAGQEAISKGVPMVKIKRLSVVQDIARMRFNISNEDADEIDKLSLKLDRAMMQLGSIYDE